MLVNFAILGARRTLQLFSLKSGLTSDRISRILNKIFERDNIEQNGIETNCNYVKN